MNNNVSPYLDGATSDKDIVKYSSDFRKVLFGNCMIEIFLKNHPVPDSVEIVEINECLFSSFGFLHHFNKLKELIILSPYTTVNSMKELLPLMSLNKLVFSNCKLTKISALDEMSELNHLELINCEIRKIEGLESLNNLRDLCLSINKIKKIEGLENNISLETLDLSSNQISKIEGLEHLRNLKKLYLEQNYIPDIEKLKNQKQLEVISLGHNLLFQGATFVSQRKLMKDLRHLPNLKSFNNYKLPLPEKVYLDPN